MRSKHWEVMLGRLKREGHLSLVGGKTVLQRGDQVSIIGTKDELEKAIPFFGQESEEHIELDRTELDFRRMFISNPKIVGIPLRDLNLLDKYGAIISRVRRGDMEFLPRGDTILELGDRVRVVSPRQKLSEVAKYLGDSYRALSEIDVLSFSLGITIGILIGAIPIPLPGGITFKLGNAGGPLIVALIVGKIHRTGPITWNLPYSANMLMRQFGLILFLASIGTRAGYPFVNTFTSGGGITIFLVGMFITISVSLLALIIGHKIFKIPMSLLVGMMSGLQTQPAVLGFALDQTKNDLPNIGYSTVFPVAIITKILLAQILLALLL
jgi:putative transport protein